MSNPHRLVGTYLLGFEPILVSVVLETRQRFNPDVERTLTHEPEGRATMDVRGPEGYLQVYEASLLQAGIHLER